MVFTLSWKSSVDQLLQMLCKIISFKNPADLEKLLFIEIASEFSLASIYTAFYQEKWGISNFITLRTNELL